jgi:protoporphyrinogen oxidase
MSKSKGQSLAIIGAGIAGLALAYYLTKKTQYQVTIFEARSEVGGLLQSINVNSAFLEKYYHHIFPDFKELLELINDLKLADRLFWHQTKMGFLYSQKIFSFNSPLELLYFSPLNILDRVRFGISLLKLNQMRDWRRLDKFTVEQVLKKYSGKASWQKIWSPLLKMKFGDDFDKVSAAWIWDRIKTRSKSLKLLKSEEKLGYLTGGFQSLIQRLVEEIVACGGQIILSTPILEIEFEDQVVNLKYRDKRQSFCKVISTIALPDLINIIHSLPADYKQRLNRVNYQNVRCCMLRLRRPLSRFYWLNLCGEDLPFGVIIEHTNLVNREDYGGENIVYLLKYFSQRDNSFLKEDSLIIQEVFNFLKQTFSNFHQNQVIEARVFRDKYAQPIFTKGYFQLKESIQSPVKRFILADTSQIYPASRSLNSAINMAKVVSERILSSEAKRC